MDFLKAKKNYIIVAVISAAVGGSLVAAVSGSSRVCVDASVPSGSVEGGVPEEPTASGKIDSNKVSLIKADSASYYSTTVSVKATAKASDYFNYAFSDMEAEYYSFEITDGGGAYLHAYGKRSKFKGLFDYLASRGGEAPIEATLVTSPKHEDNGIWTLVSWKKL
jgi:hypothetical protein